MLRRRALLIALICGLAPAVAGAQAVKLSQLPAAGTPAATDLVACDQAATIMGVPGFLTKSCTSQQVVAGAVAAGFQPLITDASSAQGVKVSSSGATLTATYATVGRTFAASAADKFNFLGQSGADPTGTNDQASALASAMTTAAANGRALYLPYGSYKLTSGNVNLPTNLPLEFGNVTFGNTGGHYIGGTVDFTPMIGAQVSAAWMRQTNYAGNDWGTFTSLNVVPTSAPADYEKGAAYFAAATSDPSTYSGNTALLTYDTVGVEDSGSIIGGISTGRAWGALIACSVASGSNGLCTGLEVDSFNSSGTDTSAVSTPTTKVGITSVAFGTTPTVDGIAVLYGTNQFHNGLDIFGNAVINYAWDLRSATNANVFTASLDPSGNLLAQQITAAGALNASAGLFASSATIVGTNAIILNGASSGAASIVSSAGPLSLTANGSSVTYLGSSTSAVTVQGPQFVGGVLNANGGATVTGAETITGLTSVGPLTGGNQLTFGGGSTASTAAAITTTAGPVSVTAAGSNTTYLGSGSSGVVIQGVGYVGGILNAQAGMLVVHMTVGTLPGCSGSSNVGLAMDVTDATSPTYLGSLTGGGTVYTPVKCTGAGGWKSY